MYSIFYDIQYDELILILINETIRFPIRGFGDKDAVAIYTEEYFFKYLVFIGDL